MESVKADPLYAVISFSQHKYTESDDVIFD